MEGGYINEGGQLKSKNGQKYVINAHHHHGIFVARTIVYFTGFILFALMLISTCLLVLLLTQSTCPAENGHSIGNDTISSSSFVALKSESETKAPTNKKPARTTTTVIPTTLVMSGNDDEDYADDQQLPDNNTNDDTIILAEGWSPVNYKLLIEPNVETSKNNGSIIIDIARDLSFSQVVPISLDINQIEILHTEVTDANHEQLDFETHYGKNNQTFNIILKEELDRIENVIVRLEFVSELGSTLQGFYKGSYKEEDSDDISWFASTQFSPIDARRAFPCFDRPDKKATFEISIVRPSDKTMFLSNMEHKGSSMPRSGYIQDDFYKTPKMSTYLVAFIISNLEHSQTSAPEFEPVINVWSRTEVVSMTSYVIQLTQKILPYLEDYFSLKFNLKKIDMVAVPDFGFSAMENWGLITFRESAMLVPEDSNKSSSAKHTERVASVIAHELAHQWFGNLVTMKWWNDLWLKEGFATYMSYECLHYAEPDWRIYETFTVNELQKAMAKDSDKLSHPISFPVDKMSDIRRIFDPISYAKGASVIRMMSSFLGKDAFKAGITEYLKTYQYSNAVQDDLWRIMTKHGHEKKTLPENLNVKDIMETWTLQAGYPVITMRRNGSTLTISQQRYMLPAADPNDKSKWFIPITLVAKRTPSTGTIPDYWLSNESNTIEIQTTADNDEWIYLNAERSGYYRTNYDMGSWKKLTSNFSMLPAITRAQLIDDAFQLARAEFIEYDIPLTFIIVLVRYPHDHAAWTATANGLNFLTNMMMKEPGYESYLAVMRSIFKQIYKEIGFDELPEESHVELMHRARMVELSCKFGIDMCTNRAQILYRNWMMDKNNNKIPPNLKENIYCTSLREGGVPEWNFAYKRYMETNSASEKELILNALGCSAKPWLLTKYLNMTIHPDSGIRKQDGARAFSAVAKNGIGSEIAFDFLYTNIEKIYEYYGEGFSTVSKMIDTVTTFMNKDYHREQFERFAKKVRKLGLKSMEKSIAVAEEQIEKNIYWRSRSYYKLESLLKQFIQQFRIQIY